MLRRGKGLGLRRAGRRGGSAGPAGWSRMLESLAGEGDARVRVAALLEAVAEYVDVPAVYLYLGDAGGRRFHLEHSRASTLPRSGVEEPGEGGVAASAATPPLEMLRAPEWDVPRIAPSAAGTLYSVPLRVRGATVGLLQVGPLAGRQAPPAWRRRLDEIAFPVAVIALRALEDERLRRELSAFQARESIGRRLQGSAMQVERHLTLLLSMAVAATGADGGFVAIVGRETLNVSLVAAQGLPDGFAEAVDLQPPDGLFDWSAAAGGTLFVHDLEAAAALGIGSILAVPLLEGSEVLGIFAVASFGRGSPIDVAALDLLATFAGQSEQALRNDRLFRTFADGYLDTVRGLARSLDARRPDTHGHHGLVARLGAEIARTIGVPPEEEEAIRLAGLVHDVGLAGTLSGVDVYLADYDHPTIGASLIEHLPLHPGVAAGVAAHHEWFDGWGFPLSLHGEVIPRPGRVLAIAEFIAEMAAGDPVRAPWGAERIAAEIRQRRGSQFDPTIADAALDLLAADRLALP